MPKDPKKDAPDDALEKMNKALRAALSTPPTKHKDEPKRSREGRPKVGGTSKKS